MKVEMKTRKQKRPARMSPGEAELFTVANLHYAPICARVNHEYALSTEAGGYPVDQWAPILLKMRCEPRVHRAFCYPQISGPNAVPRDPPSGF
jgi:hypothetical protein